MYKKADEKYLSIWWFFVIGIIGGGIVLAVLMYNINDINSKEIESDIMADKVSLCLVENGNIVSEIFNSDFNVLDYCHLSKDIIDKSGVYNLNIEIFKLSDCKEISTNWGLSLECSNPVNYFNYGVVDFKNQCFLNGKDFPSCSEKFVYVLYNDNKYLLRIFSGSNQKVKYE